MDYLSQNDPRWKDIKFPGCQKSTIGQNGCYVASLLNARKRFYPNEDYTPDRAAREWKFVRQGTDPEPHYLSYATQFPGFGLVSRVRCSGLNGERKWNDSDTNTVKAKMNMDGYAVCLEVLTKYGGRHWLFARKSFKIGGIKCVDCWKYPADIPMQTWGYLGRYLRPSGYCIIKKTA